MNDIDNINTNIDNNFVNNTTLSTLSTAIDEQFELNTTYIDDKITEQHEYTDQDFSIFTFLLLKDFKTLVKLFYLKILKLE